MTDKPLEKSGTPPLDAGVVLEAVNLHTIEFQSRGNPTHDEEGTAPVQFSVLVFRPSKHVLIVELGLTLDDPRVMKAVVKYRARFRRTPDNKDAAAVMEYWRIVCAQLAPIVMYPYIRETLAGMTAKAGMPGVLLPVMNVGAMLDPAKVNLPDEPENEEEPVG